MLVETDSHARREALDRGLEEVCQSPRDRGTVELIVRRPAEGEREVLEVGELDREVGMVGDNWSTRGSSRTADGSSHPQMQLNLMSSRVAALVAGERSRWPLAGDQLYVDLDLSAENLPPGTLLTLGTATIEVTPMPHTGCKKFVERFGMDAMRWISSPRGRALNLRGINAAVVRPGKVRVGDAIAKAGTAAEA
ncbi:MAG: MOSC domain-containing protein [Acidobacteriota bacterium]